MKLKELNHVAIQVADVERSRDFYGRVLQLLPLPRPAFNFPGAWFRLGEVQELHIIGNRTTPVHSASRGDHFALLVDDLDEWEQYFVASNVAFQARQIRPDRAYQIFLKDPDGHTIELCTPPGTAPLEAVVETNYPYNGEASIRRRR